MIHTSIRTERNSPGAVGVGGGAPVALVLPAARKCQLLMLPLVYWEALQPAQPLVVRSNCTCAPARP